MVELAVRQIRGTKNNHRAFYRLLVRCLSIPNLQELDRMNIGRKAWMAWAIFGNASALVWFDKITEGSYVALVTLVFASYATANVVGKKDGK